MNNEVVIVSAVRTAIGNFQGSLSNLSAVDLGSVVIREALLRARVPEDAVDEVFMGNVLQAGLGQNPARQAWLKAGFSNAVPATTINKVCGSGLKAIMLAAQSIRSGDADIVVAGGMENMSQSPFLIEGARSGLRMGNSTLVRGQLEDLARTSNVDVERVLEEVIYPLVPQNRLISVEEVADYAAMIASDKLRGVTGASLLVDGGYPAQ